MCVWKFCLAVGLSVALTSTATSQEASTKKTPQKTPAHFQPPEVDPTLPNVLLIGDSISIGYMLDVRRELAGQANVWRPTVNCGPTTRGVESLDQWLGDRHWDVIHFNFGLHDLKFMGKGGNNLADPSAPDSHRQVEIEQYAANLQQIAERLKATGAVVIWRETTPVPAGAKGRIPEDVVRYNEAAAEVIAKLGGIQTDPMYAYAIKIADRQRPKDVHYTPEGSEKLAQQVATSIRSALKIK